MEDSRGQDRFTLFESESLAQRDSFYWATTGETGWPRTLAKSDPESKLYWLRKEPITMTSRPLLPPFTQETAIQKVRLAEDGWNTRDPEKVSLAYTVDSRWRNRAEFANGREQIVTLLSRKWTREMDYRLIKELWAFHGNRIAVRFAYEYHDDSGNWFRAYGNENWEFDEPGLMYARHASINELPIASGDRKFDWPLGRRTDDHPGLSALGL
jgi:uncharacterized protein